MISLATPNAHAYEVDFHYYVIYLLLRARAYTHADANQLAGFSQYVDDNAQTEPLKNRAPRRAAFHFAGSDRTTATTADVRVARDALTVAFLAFNRGDADGKYRAGAALHLLADTFSHASFTAWWNRDMNCRAGSWRPCIGHADTDEGGHAPDYPYNAPVTAGHAARAIYDLIPQAPYASASTTALVVLKANTSDPFSHTCRMPEASGPTVSWTVLEPQLSAAFRDTCRASLASRINAVRSIVEAQFNIQAQYNLAEFRIQKAAFEAAVVLP